MNFKKKIIKKINENNGSLRLDYFIDLVLNQKNSYYNSINPIGVKGDFITSPEISQMFGEIIGLYILNHWINNIGSKFNLIELGPGKGTLLEDILRASKIEKKFINSLKIELIEKNEKLIEIQKKTIKSINIKKINWSKKFNANSDLPSIIFSNEFFDCLPIRQFYKKNHWYEKEIKYNSLEDTFSFKDKKIHNKKTLDKLNKYQKNNIAEISSIRLSLFKKICRHLVKNKGLLILIDYGYKNPIKNFTLQSVSMHKKSHIFENLGKQDITSLVNFGELINIANDCKLKILSYCTQREFLIKNGIQKRKERLKENLSYTKKENIEKDYVRLTDINGMGNEFKFFIISS